MPIRQKNNARELTLIEELISKGNFSAAIRKVETLEQREDLLPSDRLTCHLHKSTIMNNLGYYEESLRLVETVLKERQRLRKHLQVVDVLIAKAEALCFLGRFDASLNTIEQSEHELTFELTQDQLTEIHQRKVWLIFLKGFIYVWSDLEKAWEYSQQSLAQAKEMGHKLTIAWSLWIIGYIYYWKGDLGQAWEYTKQSLARAKEMGNKHLIAWSFWIIAHINTAKGDLEQGLKYSQKSLIHAEEIDQKYLIAWLRWTFAYIYMQKGDWEQALEYYQQNMPYAKEMGYTLIIALTLAQIGFIYTAKGDLELALEYGQQSLVLAEETGHKLTIAWSRRIIGEIYRQKGDWEKSLEYYKQSLVCAQEENHKHLIANAHSYIGLIYTEKGDFEQAMEHYQQGLACAEEMGNKLHIANALLNIGIVYREQGDLDKALEHLEQSLTIEEKMGYKYLIPSAFWNIGDVYRQKGNLDQALVYFQKSLTLGKEIGFKSSHYATSLVSIGIIYREKGDLELALDHLEQSLVLYEKLGHKLWMSESLFHLISILIDKTSLEQAQRYLQRLQQLNEQEDNKIISQRCQVAEALLLKTSSRARHRTKAEELFEQVAEEEVVEHEVTVVALLNLCDLLLAELRLSGNPEVLSEVQSHVTRLLEIAKQQHSHWVYAETSVLQAKLALVELDVSSARQYLDQAQIIAEERGLRRLAMQISTEHDTLLDQLSQWEDFINRNVPLAERAELAHLEEQVVHMLRKRMKELPELPEEEPELVLIIEAESGLCLFSKPFRSDRPLEEHLIAGFLTAINNFVRDAFAVGGSIERIKHQEYTLLLKIVEPFLVSYVFKGYSYFAQKKLSQFTKALQASHSIWQALTDATQTKRMITDTREVEVMIIEKFLTSAKGSF